MFPDVGVRAIETSSYGEAIPVIPVRASEFPEWLKSQPQRRRRWLESLDFSAGPNTQCLVPGPEGSLECVVLAIDDQEPEWSLGRLPRQLPAGEYRLESSWGIEKQVLASIAWGLGAYRYDRFKKRERERAILVLSPTLRSQDVEAQIRAVYRVRDWINTPASDMMPVDLGRVTRELAGLHAGVVQEIVGDALLQQGYPLIHAVGRASDNVPRLIDLQWGKEGDPAVVLVGKGVCFDSGGLNLKPGSSMRLMKKDMGGAAHVLGLAGLIMEQALPVRLRVLIPAVENAVSGRAYRPGDVLTSRSGITVEVDNTDAEGRLVLGDALVEAGACSPELILDFATLTGAARVALGTEVPGFFTGSDTLASGLQAAAERVSDPLWRLPLHRPYRSLIDSDIADIVNCTDGPFGGAITAALFLEEFVPHGLDWVHLDLMGWNNRDRPGRPKGGEAMGVRAVFDYLKHRFGSP